jgi:Protein of unknown function (DUF3000)
MSAGLPRSGVPHDRKHSVAVPSRIVADVRSAAVPAEFAGVVRSLSTAVLRRAVRTTTMRAPQRLAPWTHALGLEVVYEQQEVATGRLVLLHDPQGYEAWQGAYRLVGYASVDLEPELAADPLLPEVGWSWLTDALRSSGAEHLAVAGTVTQTTSTRFGAMPADEGHADVALAGEGQDGPARTSELELRASWTPVGLDLGRHLQAWAELMCVAAGLPPEGVTAL